MAPSLIVVYLSANYCCHLHFNVAHQDPGPESTAEQETQVQAATGYSAAHLITEGLHGGSSGQGREA